MRVAGTLQKEGREHVRTGSEDSGRLWSHRRGRRSIFGTASGVCARVCAPASWLPPSRQGPSVAQRPGLGD